MCRQLPVLHPHCRGYAIGLLDMRPWILQPKNYNQVLTPNYYTIAYRRTGTYKGMGQAQAPSLAPGYAPGSPQDQMAACVIGGGSPGDCVTALGQTGVLGLGTGTSIWPWVIGGVLLVALMVRR